MGAFNWIRFEAKCPVCGQVAAIVAQTHVASDFGGDARGRFVHADYGLGQRMRWFEGEHADEGWMETAGQRTKPIAPGVCEEACYAECRACNAELVAVVRFESVTPQSISYLAPEHDWPDGFWK